VRRATSQIAVTCGTAILAFLCLTAAGPAKDEFRFVILGDRTGSAQKGVYEQVWREIDAWRPGMVINVGDTIQGGNDATAAAEWREMRPLFAQYSRYPLYFTPGNHDIWSEASERLYERETKRPPHYSFDFGTAHFTVLDNSRTEALSEAQMQFLQADLEKQRAGGLKFVFFHKPYWLLQVMMGADFPLHRLAVKHGVRYVVAGHAHRFARFERDGVVYLMVGSSGARLRSSRFEEGWFYHHVRVTVSGGQVSMLIKEADAPFGRSRTFTEQDWGSGPVMKSRPAAAGQ
jgi:predicted phosphodiesterase